MKQFFLLGLLACTTILSAQLNTTLRDNLDYPQSVNDVWGYVAPDGTEYAIVGTQTGTSFVSLADPDNLIEVVFIPGDNSTWRDIKTFGEYAYTVADQGNQGITAFDLSGLPNNVTFKRNVFQLPGSNRSLIQSHNLYIDTLKGRMYTTGGNENRSRINAGGIVIFDLNTDPMTPEFVGFAPAVYSHDVFSKGDTLYCSEIYEGKMSMYDISDLDDIKALGSTQTPFDFTHNAWTTEDAQFVFTTDEEPNAPVAAYDVRDKNDIKLLFEFRPLESIGTGVIPHNVHVIDDYLSISYYTDGLRVADASKPDNIIEVANYDTWPGPDGDFNGCWGAYPFLPSGLTLLTDRSTGLYVVEVDYKRAARLEGSITDELSGRPINGVQIEIAASQTIEATTDALGNYKTGLADGGMYDITISAPSYEPITVTRLLENGVCTIFDTTLNTSIPRVNIGITVINDETEEVIPNASFVFKNDDYAFNMLTNAEGKVAIDYVFEGDYELYVAEWGYYTKAEFDISPTTLGDRIFRLTPGYMDDFVTDEGWTVSGDALEGNWERAVPNGTFFRGLPVNPGRDASGDLGQECYVTGNIGGNPRDGDVEGGVTTITSPTFGPLRLAELKVSYQYWFANVGGEPINDTLTISITNGLETAVVKQYVDDGDPRWIADSFRVDDYVDVTRGLQLIVTTSDFEGSDHLVEGGFDNFLVYGRQIPSGTDNHFTSNLQAKVFPNPSQEAFNLQYTGQSLANPSIRVTDALGRMVSQQAFSGESVSFGENLPTGLYFAELFDGGMRVYVTKVIKK
ncbi:choice-of-anchor B family protein [Neolewinella persica]|uniref:choice-of-anchor B family protein n=1 Tax=Neolewinella persica TaxID=70998 RepID=UPI00036BAF79|nr:choice-of-anchor B family protein [Neolewinella persica]